MPSAPGSPRAGASPDADRCCGQCLNSRPTDCEHRRILAARDAAVGVHSCADCRIIRGRQLLKRPPCGSELGPDDVPSGEAAQDPAAVQHIGSAIRDVESIPGLRVTGAGQEDLVSVLEIAQRAQRSREAVRLWTAGKRGPGGFPDVVWQTPGGERFWSWAEVARWIRATLNLAVEAEPDEVRWADEVLKARQAVAEARRILDEHEGMREYLGPLLSKVG